MEDPNKAIYVLFHNDLDELSSELKKLDKEVERVKMSGEMSQNSRKETLKSLEESRKQMLLSADALNDALDSARLQMKNGK
jgi:superfamily II DNA/RNA helicase